MFEGDLRAVVSFIGVLVQLGGELLLVLLFMTGVRTAHGTR